MAELASSPDRVKTAELAERLDATPAFLAQVVGELVRLGWVRSDPGPTGGYQLLVDTAELSVLEVIESLEGPTADDQCVVVNAPCSVDGHCALHEGWTAARAVLLDHLRATTVEQVAAEGLDRTVAAPTAVESITDAPDQGG